MKKKTMLILCAVLLFLGVFFAIRFTRQADSQAEAAEVKTEASDESGSSENIEVSNNTVTGNDASLNQETTDPTPEPSPESTVDPTQEPSPEPTPEEELTVTEEFRIELGETEDVGGF